MVERKLPFRKFTCSEIDPYYVRESEEMSNMYPGPTSADAFDDLSSLFGRLEGWWYQGPVVQSVVSLTSSLRVFSLTVLAASICNILIFFAEKM